MNHTILGLEVKPNRVNFAVHEIGPGTHRFVRDGSIYVPSSMSRKEAHNEALDEGLTSQFSSMLDLEDDLSVFCESYTRKMYYSDSYKWIHERLTEFFADNTEIMGIPIATTPNREVSHKTTRKALKVLHPLDGYTGTLKIANYIAHEGGRQVNDDIYDFWR